MGFSGFGRSRPISSRGKVYSTHACPNYPGSLAGSHSILPACVSSRNRSVPMVVGGRIVGRETRLSLVLQGVFVWGLRMSDTFEKNVFDGSTFSCTPLNISIGPICRPDSIFCHLSAMNAVHERQQGRLTLRLPPQHTKYITLFRWRGASLATAVTVLNM
jgi:hypothetical protein